MKVAFPAGFAAFYSGNLNSRRRRASVFPDWLAQLAGAISDCPLWELARRSMWAS